MENVRIEGLTAEQQYLYNQVIQVLGKTNGTVSELDHRFAEYHVNNPHVYSIFVDTARVLKDAGQKKYSARGILHILRWRMYMEVKRTDGFKVSNNASARYVRLLEHDFPEFIGFFTKRKLKGEQNNGD